MANIKSASSETLRAYRLDLHQALNVKLADLPKLDELLGGGLNTPSRPKAQIKALNPLPTEAVLEICREALHKWTHLSPASRNRKSASLKSFLNWLHDEQLIDRDLALQIHAPKVPHRLPHHLSVDEALALLHSIRQALENAPSDEGRQIAQRDLALILLLYGGGLRVSEACGLEWARVDKKGRLVRIRGKGGQERMVALPPMTITALESLLPARGDYVFGEKPLQTRTAYEIVRSRGAQAGLLKPLHPHALRHSYATHLLSSGANLRTLQELLGHRTLQATQRYTHIGIDQLARTLESFHPLGHAPKEGPKRRRS